MVIYYRLITKKIHLKKTGGNSYDKDMESNGKENGQKDGIIDDGNGTDNDNFA